MGFGLLLIGYLITYVVALNTYGVAFRLVGYIIIAYAIFKLSAYEKKFKPAGYAAGALALSSLVGVAALVCGFLYDNMLIDTKVFGTLYEEIMAYIEAAGVLVFHVLLLLAIRKLAKDTGVHKIELNTGRDMFFIGLYYILRIIGYLPLPIKDAYAKYMGLPLTVLYLVWIIFEIELMFSCYARICDESDVEMERKPSRFAFVNKLRAELDEKQERAKADAERLRRERLERRREKKNKKL